MYVNIDMENLKVLHIHPDHSIVRNLLYLEGTKVRHATTEDTTRPGFLDGLTSMELALLYRNTTNGEFPAHFDNLSRRQAIIDTVESISARKVVETELQAQVDHVIDYLEEPIETAHVFRYVHGARIPAIDDGGLFPLTTPPRSPSQLEQAATVAPQRLAVRAADSVAPVRAPRPTRERSGPSPLGSAKPIVWAHADKVWEDAGKPTNVATVLELRKRMMTELEEKGIKKSTSSTALGNWMKDRLSSVS